MIFNCPSILFGEMKKSDEVAPITPEEVHAAYNHGWKLTDVGRGGRTGKRVFTVECIRGHVCKTRQLTEKCTICKMMANTLDQCTQLEFIHGRSTFEFECVRGHKYYCEYTSQKPTPKCRSCELEDVTAKIQMKIIRGVYHNTQSRLCYQCKCGQIGYTNGAVINKVILTIGVAAWCATKHKKSIRRDVLRTVVGFSYLFGCPFDDNDLMYALDVGLQTGVYFTGYNRRLKLAFICGGDPKASSDLSSEYNWCGRKGITLVQIKDVGNNATALSDEIYSALMELERFPSNKTVEDLKLVLLDCK